MKNNNDVQTFIRSHIPLVNFIADVVGKNSEVVLHDLTNLDSSVILIRNNHITEREVGAPATDFVLKLLKENKNEERNYITNYRGITKNTQKTLRSSSYFLRYDGDIVGMICVNTDETVLQTLNDNLQVLLNFYSHENDTNEEHEELENFSQSIEDMADTIVAEITTTTGVSVEYLKSDDKRLVIERLYDRGFFLLKGAVPEIAKTLQISEPTVYRYLQSVKKNGDE